MDSSAPRTFTDSPSLKQLVCGFSVEVTAHDPKSLQTCARLVPPGTDVYINWLPADTYQDRIHAAVELRRSGLNPVPHLAVRYIASSADLSEFLARARGEAGITQVLVIGGDVFRAVGPFASALDALETGLFERNGIERIGIAGHPEGSPRIGAAQLDCALRAKAAYADRSTASFYIVTQFCFDVDPILSWIRRVRDDGIRLPVRIGLAGPASITTLVKFGLRCGVGNSIKALGLHGAAIARLLTESNPGHVISALDRLKAADPELGIAGFHFFPFGGLARLSAWLETG